ncbi:hypothetical protein [Mixta intestinalis]|uniref:Polyketide cyclase / dehydrase and lipid transport n=1 Tax=Mixta intestinalis TaxID=1615494 RepID=A0A6P1Q721_9GAMM|nr:hypothetical protein [Mixta intestinalis]QHM74004.1 hypothetical protein C7M51_04365 [Mixta intestinalis]
MSSISDMTFVFESSVTIPALYASRIWDVWEALEDWHKWDASLKGTRAQDNGLTLGKRFEIVTGQGPVPVCVTALIAGFHFTTTAQTSFGSLSFGHTLSPDKNEELVKLTHSILATANSPSTLPHPLLEKLQADVVDSVEKLADFVQQKEDSL